MLLSKRKYLYWVCFNGRPVYVGVSEHPHYRIRTHKNSKKNPSFSVWLKENWGQFDLKISRFSYVSSYAHSLELKKIKLWKKRGGCEFNRTQGN